MIKKANKARKRESWENSGEDDTQGKEVPVMRLLRENAVEVFSVTAEDEEATKATDHVEAVTMEPAQACT